MRHRLPTLAILVFGGCSSLAPTDEALPRGALPLAAPATYRTWFERTEACSDLRGRFEQIHWYVVPEVETFATAAGPKVGMWEKSAGTARIIVAGRYVDHEMVVRHEMLHHLLDREGHPAEYFVQRCRLTWDSWSQVTASQ
jgi:hypothetical protein